MVHFLGKSGVGGMPIVLPSVGFNPPSGAYAGSFVNVQISVTAATKLRHKINNGAWTTVNATSAVVTVTLTLTGKTLYADALDANSNILASRSSFYQLSTEGGQ